MVSSAHASNADAFGSPRCQEWHQVYTAAPPAKLCQSPCQTQSQNLHPQVNPHHCLHHWHRDYIWLHQLHLLVFICAPACPWRQPRQSQLQIHLHLNSSSRATCSPCQASGPLAPCSSGPLPTGCTALCVWLPCFFVFVLPGHVLLCPPSLSYPLIPILSHRLWRRQRCSFMFPTFSVTL